MTGCSKIPSVSDTTDNHSKNDNDRFLEFVETAFIESVQSDTITLNYFLENPSLYGINQEKVSLGSYSLKAHKESIISTENNLNTLNSISYEKLTDENKLTYDILKEYLKLHIEMADFIYYEQILSPTTGIQAQLPILLAEYNFHTKQDIDKYLELLLCVQNLFDEIIILESEKAELGLFMNDHVLDAVLKQCNAFTFEPSNNFLIDHFNEKIHNFNGLTPEEIASYKERNESAIIDHVVPAYEFLTKGISDLRGKGINDLGLSNLPKGKDYYEALVKRKVGTDKSTAEVAKVLDAGILSALERLNTVILEDNDVMEAFASFESFPLTNPEQILFDLQSKMIKDFPDIVPVDYEIKYVPESLEEHLSPAMYLVPPVDNYTDNTIYINGSDKDTLSQIYTTMAHEGYPGHLYQNVSFRSSDPEPIRVLLGFPGYTEGWATYVELHSYELADIDKNLGLIMSDNNLIILCMYARLDVGIHYEGWEIQDVETYINKLGFNKSLAPIIHEAIIEDPGIYLPYAVGCLEFLNLKEMAKNRLGSDFILKDFHEFLLKIGPAQFNIIEEELDIWISHRQGD